MAAPPYMPLYVGDYLADTTHLTRDEHGAYLLLLMAMWRAGGKLPGDDARLARLAKCTSVEWEGMKDIILDFFQRKGGHVTHGRMAVEIARYDDKVLKARNAGLASASKKANKFKASTPTDVATGVKPKINQPEPEPEPEEEEEEPKGSPSPRLKSEPAGWSEFWTAYPRKVAKPDALKAYSRAVSRSSLAEILAGLTAHLEPWADVPTNFIPHAATWLNRDGWNDTPPIRNLPNDQRFDDQSNRTGGQFPPNARRANTDNHRSAWAEVIAERSSDRDLSGDDRRGEVTSDERGSNHLRLAHAR